VTLNVQAVLQSQRAQLVVAQQPFFVALYLPRKLAGPFLKTRDVKLAREIHNIYFPAQGSMGSVSIDGGTPSEQILIKRIHITAEHIKLESLRLLLSFTTNPTSSAMLRMEL